MTRMVAAIIISFGCYLPVTLLSKSKPKVGLLMIPKTCAYMWVIAMGLQLFSDDCLEMSESMEANGNRTFGYDVPIIYKRVR